MLRKGEQPTEPTDVADDLGPVRRTHLVLDRFDGFFARGDVDTRVLVGLAHSGVRSENGRLVQRALELSWWHGVLLEHLLEQLDRYLDGIAAGETRVAETG